MIRKIFAASLAALCLECAGGKGEFQHYELNTDMVYQVKCHFEGGITTIQFPSSIDGLSRSVNVLTKEEASQMEGDFVIEAKKGSYYLNVRALRKGAVETLNIIFRRKLYVLKLEDGGDEAKSGVIFQGGGGARQSSTRYQGKGGVTPPVLKGLLDKSQMYDKFLRENPNGISGSIRWVPPDGGMRFNYRKFDAVIEEVIRYEAYDTLVFRVVLENKTATELAYDPKLLAARCGERIFYSAFSDASGVMPPQGKSLIYFCVTGTSDGFHNFLEAKNPWVCLVTLADEKEYVKMTEKDRDKIYEVLEHLQKRAEKTTDPEALGKLKEDLETVQEYLNEVGGGDGKGN